MCNCGNKRSQLQQFATGMPAKENADNAARQTWPPVNFVYTGQTALSVTGNVTGKRYRFNAPGEQQLIDYQDASFMLTVPVLQKVS